MNLPRELPIWGAEQAILQGLKTHRVVIVSAETGSGKTTQIPQMLWHAGYGYKSLIGVTQPRRVAASSVAKRVAEELQVSLGQQVGFQVRFEEKLGPQTEIKFATEGIFLWEARRDPTFRRYSVLMLDEVHERSLDMDALLGLVKLALAIRDDFRVVISSATVNVAALQEFFGAEAIVVECEGRVFPVEVHYEETDPSYRFTRGIRARYDEEAQPPYEMPEFAADKAVELIRSGERGDILVFLSGYDDLQRAKERLEAVHLGVEVLLAHGEMELPQLEQLFEPHDRQRAIFATNVAETSLTIPGVTVVIDSGQVKRDHFHSRYKMVVLRRIKTSQSSCEQRAGRAGRTQPGRCYRLFTASDYEERPLYDEPAVTRSNLASVLLTLASVGVRHFADFPFLDQPTSTQIEAAATSLREIGALDQGNQLTDYGRRVARFPLSPERAHLLIQAHQNEALMEMLTLLALTDVNPYRRHKKGEWPPHLALVGECESDPEALLTVWDGYCQSRWDKSGSWAAQYGLRPKALQEARRIRAQLLLIAEEQGLRPESPVCDYSRLKKALVRISPGQVALAGVKRFSFRPLDGEWDEAYIHPSSLLHKEGEVLRALWSLNAQATTKVFLHCCLPLSTEELVEYLGERLTVSYTISRDRILKKEYLRRCLSWQGRIVVSGESTSWSTDEWQSGVAYPFLDTWRSFSTKDLTAEEYRELLAAYQDHRERREEVERVAAEYAREVWLREREEQAEVRREIEEMRQRNEREESTRRQEAQALRATLPELPPDAPAEISQLWQQTADALEAISAPGACSLPEDLAKACEAIPELHRLLAEHQQAAGERQAAIEESRLLLDLHVGDNLRVCPLCYGLWQENRCSCAQAQTPSSLGLDNGDTEKDLVRLVTVTDRVLARAFVFAPREGRRWVIREVHPVVEPFDDIVVERLTTTA